jgi:hypothetical protein
LCVLAVLPAVLFSIAARAGEIDRAKLLELAEVPEASIQFNYNFSSEDVRTEEAEEYYRAHLADFASKGHLTFRMIGIDEGAEAPAKMDAIDADLDQMSFEAAARKFYGVEGASEGSFLWKKSLESLSSWKQPLVKEILEMKAGEVRRRIALGSGAGWRYVELVAFTQGGTIPFEEARPGIDDAIRLARMKKAIDEALKRR